jgi:hypothetical protein
MNQKRHQEQSDGSNKQECVAIDEIETRATVASNVSNYEIDAIVVAANLSVERTRPDLGIGRELVCI